MALGDMNWVCSDCGEKYGRRQCSDGATWHPDICSVCKAETFVTEPRDFGGIRIPLVLPIKDEIDD